MHRRFYDVQGENASKLAISSLQKSVMPTKTDWATRHTNECNSIDKPMWEASRVRSDGSDHASTGSCGGVDRF